MSFKLLPRSATVASSFLAALGGAVCPGALAAELLINGDFETGNFTGWTTSATVTGRDGASTARTAGWFVDVPGSSTPLSGTPTLGTGGGTHGNGYAVADSTTDPGLSNFDFLLQTAIVPTGVLSATWSFDLMAQDFDPEGVLIDGVSPRVLALPTFGLNTVGAGSLAFDWQFVSSFPGRLTTISVVGVPDRVPFTVTRISDALAPFFHYEFDVTALIAPAPNTSVDVFFGGFVDGRSDALAGASPYSGLIGLDNVSLRVLTAQEVAVPAPGTLPLSLLALAVIGLSRRRQGRTTFLACKVR